MKKIDNQPSLFRILDSTGRLKPVDNSSTPLLHQKAYSNAQSALALERFTASGDRQTLTEAVGAYLFAHQGTTTQEIVDHLVYINKKGIVKRPKNTGDVSGRYEDLRKKGYDLLNDHGKWSIKKRENR